MVCNLKLKKNLILDWLIPAEGIFYFSLLVLLTICGCDRTDSVLKQQTSIDSDVAEGESDIPRQILKNMVQAYGKLSSYTDQGFVRLQYEINDQHTEDRAPLTVAWDDHGRLGLRVYAIEAGPNGTRWHLRWRDNSSLARQVLSRTLPSKVNLPWLVDDSFAKQGLAAGPAGFPPQLDLLLAEKPLSGLMQEATAVTMKPQQIVDGRACNVIEVRLDSLSYVLWIDQATMMLRRLLLPVQNLPSEMLADKAVSKIHLSIELPGVTVDEPIDWSNFKFDVEPKEILVTQFVPTPEKIEVGKLGVRIPGFRLFSPEGKLVYETGTGTEPNAKVLIWLADHPASQVAANQLKVVEQSISQELGDVANQIEFYSLWAEPSPPAGIDFLNLASSWGLPGKLVHDREALGRDLFAVQEAPTVVVVDRQNRVQFFESRHNPLWAEMLPGLIQDVAKGVSVANSTIKQIDEENNRFLGEVQLAAAIDNRPGNLPNPTSYSGRWVTFDRQNQQAFAKDISALTSDNQHSVWVLNADGEVSQYISGAQEPRRHSTGWNVIVRPHDFLADPSGRFLVRTSREFPTIDLYDVQNKTSKQIELSSGDVPQDLCWMPLVGAKQSRLAVLATSGSLTLIDPSGHEQLTGQCPGHPLALIPSLPRSSSVGGYVILESGQVEALMLPAESAHLSGPLLGRPISSSNIVTPADQLEKLKFVPGAGRWNSAVQGDKQRILARGWISRDEPALFLVDNDLRPIWHQRIPVTYAIEQKSIASSAVDPKSGQFVWAVTFDKHTLHFLRADGLLLDHMRVSEPIVGLVLRADGSDLQLWIAHERHIDSGHVHWLP
ncbi:MAG: hypothetical protein KDB03_11075 [Planctomycetales bacterium]|nr:hypothetical protein [Planctomycetales bacterium]